MNTLQTFKLWLEPDRDIPQFRRLRWAIEAVSIRDVLLHGVHPWVGSNKHYNLPDTILRVVNDPTGHIPELEQFHYCPDIMTPSGYAWDKPSKFERTLHVIRENMYFVDNLSYLELLDIAKAMLRRQWTHSMAREMAQCAYSGFQELRQFLKSKDKSLKLSSYEDIDHHDLSKLLTLEDFSEWDSLIISHAIPTLNFRKSAILNNMTDSQGRLRLAPQIRHVTLTEKTSEFGNAPISWCIAGEGSAWRFHPDLGESREKRPQAEAFAKRWRTDKGRLCFSTSTEKLVEMVERGIVEHSFPTLNYEAEDKGPIAHVTVHGSQVQTFRIGGYPRQNATGELLKDILHQYDVPMTGNKEQLIQKLAALAAKKYLDRAPEMDRFFEKHRYIRMRTAPNNTAELPILEDLINLRNLVLTMYAVKHLRGDAILEVFHQNDTYTEEELAFALITGKVELNGAFLCVA